MRQASPAKRVRCPIEPASLSGAFTGVLRCHSGLVVRLSPVAGYGVFLNVDALEGARIEECLTLRTELNGVGTSDYVFEVRDDDDELIPLLPLGYGALYNHSATPNVEWEYDPDTDLLSFFALRAIAAGEELLFDYGALYWESRPELRAR